MSSVIDDISAIITGCQDNAAYFGEAFTKINNSVCIVKVPNQTIEDIIIRRTSGEVSILADLINNFRTIDGKPLGHLDTKQGKLPIPRFWPTNCTIIDQYGLPYRGGEPDIIVDAYILNNEWEQKLITIKTLPAFTSWS